LDEERDVVVFVDDDGNEFELDVIDYFEHEDQEYAVLMDLSELPEECGCGIKTPYMEIIGRAGTSKGKSCAITASELLKR